MAPLILALLLVQSPASAPRLEDGIRLVEQGDFEAAVEALRAVAASLAGDPARAVERARAHLYLGVAHVALDQAADARREFVEALRDDPRLRLTEDRYSPKVISAFEAARRAQPGATNDASSRKGGSTRKVVVGAIAGAAVAAGAVIALGGSNGANSVRIANARFASPTIECPDNSNAVPINFAVLADVTNDGDTAAVLAVEITAIIAVSNEPEVGQSSVRPVVPTPSSLPARRTTTVRFDSTLLCSNGPGGPPRSNEWTARLIVTTSAGTVAAATSSNLTVSSP